MKMTVGIDLVSVKRIEESLDQFGDRVLDRIFTKDEVAYARAGFGDAGKLAMLQRLAARFAAKEAAIKALDLSEQGVSWRDLEVVKTASGACEMRMHGRAKDHLKGGTSTTLSMSHEGDLATAVLVAYEA